MYNIVYCIQYKIKMASTISVRLDEKTQKELLKVERIWKADRSEVIRRLLYNALREWKIQNSLELLSQRKISLGKAAEESEISIWEMLDVIKERNIDWTDYSEESLEKDLKMLE